jgi:hypothetical protein
MNSNRGITTADPVVKTAATAGRGGAAGERRAATCEPPCYSCWVRPRCTDTS